MADQVLTIHLDLLLVLLAEEGIAADAQRQRVERLVRALRDVQVSASLSEAGRPVPLRLDEAADPPVLTVNERLFARVDDEEMVLALQEPIAAILGLSPLQVGLVLQAHDPQKLKGLYTRAVRALEERPLRPTQIPAVVEQRLDLFADRLERAAEAFGETVFLMLDGREAFAERLESGANGWPEWVDVADAEFVRDAVEEIDAVMAGVAGFPGELMVECFWESLAVSPRTFLRHAARQLRAHKDVDDVEGALRALASVVELGDDLEYIDSWTSYSDLAQAWEALFRAEQQRLYATPTRQATPRISPFVAPLESFGLCEPESLPWDSPLLCWSMREQRALTDLVRGHVQSLAPRDALWRFQRDLTSGDTRLLSPVAEPHAFELEPVSGGAKEPCQSEHGSRAVGAAWRLLADQFGALSASEQQQVLTKLRGAYDGYFAVGKEIWARRFQNWKKLEPEAGFERLVGEAGHLLGPLTLLDPFEEPSFPQTRSIPTFTIVVPWPSDAEHSTVPVPVLALQQAFHEAPVRLRIVEVPDDDAEACRWLADVDLTLETLNRHAIGLVVKAIQNDCLLIKVRRADASSR